MCHDYEFRTHIVKTNKQREFERRLKQDNIAEGHTCLTCCNTKQAVGPKLLCELDNSSHRLNDTCSKYKSISFGVRVSTSFVV